MKAPARTFDARPDRLDLRDLPYRPPVRSLPPRYPDDVTVRDFVAGYVAQGLVLDQGTEGACTGFGLAGVVNYLFWVRYVEQAQPQAKGKREFQRVSPRMLYELAKRYDEWPGQDYEGSSCRGALKGWHKHGVCAEPLWPYPLDEKGKPIFERAREGWELDAAGRPLGVYYRIGAEVVDLQAAIAEIGAVYVSANVHDGWDSLVRPRAASTPVDHAALPVIPPPKDPRKLGGHAFALVGYNERGFVVQNSWGTTWGAAGFAVLPYDDFVEHLTDAWACALGVPVQLPFAKATRMRPVLSSRWRVASGQSLTTIDRSARNPHNPPDDPWPIDHAFEYAEYEPWSTHGAYVHTLVSGNDGRLIVSDITRAAFDVVPYAREIIVDSPLAWAAAAKVKTLKLAVYAHGGLNDETESIRRLRVLGPYFEANGIYPLFLTWKTGIGETLCDLVQDWARRILGQDIDEAAGVLDMLGDAKDRAVEALAHVLGKGIWTQMRENADLSKSPDRALDLLARNLADLAAGASAQGVKLELHLAGHSAGSILLGHLLDRAMRPDVAFPAAKTCTLFAPACSTRFAVDHYIGAEDAGLLDLKQLAIYCLTDENEKRDGLPAPELPAYGKSLLYLVSRALDDRRKMPLLGMERALLPAYRNDTDQWAEEELASVKAWQSRWKGAALAVSAADVRMTRTDKRTQATHGSFDNNIDSVTQMLERIAGRKLVAPIEWLDYQ